MTAEECWQSANDLSWTQTYEEAEERALRLVQEYGQQQYRAGVEALRDWVRNNASPAAWEKYALLPREAFEEAARLLEGKR